MSGLDGQVRTLAEPMMLGKPTALSSDDQAVIAAWVAMKSMVLEFMWGADQKIVLAAGLADVRVPAPAGARRHASTHRRRRIPRPAGTRLPPRLPTAAGLNGRRTGRGVRVVYDPGAWLLRPADLCDVSARSVGWTAAARPQLSSPASGRRREHQLAASAGSRRRGPRPVRESVAAIDRRLRRPAAGSAVPAGLRVASQRWRSFEPR